MTKKIRELMKQKGITGRKIARARGVSETWVSLVLNDKGKSRPIERMIARALRVPVSEIRPRRKAA